MIFCVNNEDLESIARLTVTFRDVCKLPLQFCMTLVQKDKTAMLDLEIDTNLHYSHKGSFSGGSHNNIMCEKLHIWINYRGVFP